jgi:hypothetical protein
MKHFSKYLDSIIHEATKIQASDTKYMSYSRWLQSICHKYEGIKTDFLPNVCKILQLSTGKSKQKYRYIQYVVEENNENIRKRKNLR